MCDTPKRDNTMTDKEWVTFSWNYFQLLSNQRMQMINFYITIEVVLVGALFTVLNLDAPKIWMSEAVALAIFFVSIIFAALDYRTKTMIHSCENSIKKIESMYDNYETTVLPFTNIDKNSPNSNYSLTYGKIFLFQFCVIALFGFILFFLIFKGIL